MRKLLSVVLVSLKFLEMENHRIRRFLQKEANAAKLNASLKDDQQNITSDLGNLLNNMKLSDFKFTVHGDDFHVHKAILAGRLVNYLLS